jgi:GMP synthase (glutamine-hydrolysing)
MKALTIIKAGSTFPATQQRLGDFEDWVIRASGLPEETVSVVNVADGDALPPVEKLSGVIITGSHAMLTDRERWMLELEAWIPKVIEHNAPLLGICFGHQLLAQAMGGRADYNPKGREIGTVAIRLTSEGQRDRLLGTLPEVFFAHTTHAQTIMELPVNSLRLAENPLEAHHAFRLGDKAWGVQFHPEFSAEIMSAYVSEQTAALLKQGYDVAALQSAICCTDAANALIKRFVVIVQENYLHN